MRIVQLANLVHPTSGGLRVVLERLGRGYLDAGHDRVVIAPGAQARRERRTDGTEWITEPGVRVPGSGGYRVLVDRARLRALLHHLAPDAVEVSDRFTLPWVASWARAQGIPATVIVHERLDHVLRTALPAGVGAARLAAPADRWLARTVGPVVVPSADAARRFPDGDAEVVPWGVDLAVFHPEQRQRPATTRPVRLISVGRLSPDKRPELAIDVLAALLDRGVHARLELLGDGPLRARLRRRARSLPVSMPGHLPVAEVARRLASADIALSTCPSETYGLAALEALACGTCVVVPTTGALPELLDCPPGVPSLTPAGAVASATPLAMAFAVERLLGIDPAERRAAARAQAEARPWSVAVTAMLARHTGTVPATTGLRVVA